MGVEKKKRIRKQKKKIQYYYWWGWVDNFTKLQLKKTRVGNGRSTKDPKIGLPLSKKFFFTIISGNDREAEETNMKLVKMTKEEWELLHLTDILGDWNN